MAAQHRARGRRHAVPPVRAPRPGEAAQEAGQGLHQEARHCCVTGGTGRPGKIRDDCHTCVLYLMGFVLRVFSQFTFTFSRNDHICPLNKISWCVANTGLSKLYSFNTAARFNILGSPDDDGARGGGESRRFYQEIW